MGGRALSERMCYWCGASAPKTRDHVFPRCLFPHPMPSDVTPITVPACQEHNRAFSRDEEYFRDFLLGASYAHPEARAIWDEKTTKALRRSPKYRAMLARSIRDMEVKSAGGIYLGTVSVLTANAERVRLVLRKIVTGLYFHEYAERLAFPELSVYQIQTSEDFAAFKRWFDAMPLRQQGHIKYKFSRAEDAPQGTLGGFFFFDRAFFMVVTDPRVEVGDPLTHAS